MTNAATNAAPSPLYHVYDVASLRNHFAERVRTQRDNAVGQADWLVEGYLAAGLKSDERSLALVDKWMADGIRQISTKYMIDGLPRHDLAVQLQHGDIRPGPQ